MKKIFTILLLLILTITPFATKEALAENNKLSAVAVSVDNSDETTFKIQALQAQIISLLKIIVQLKQSIAMNATKIENIPINNINIKGIKAPRINYWWGKVNQHIDTSTGLWETDPDGVSGANLDKLTYCKKWYPNTVAVKDYKYENIDSWQSAGNTGKYSSNRMSSECVQGTVTAEKPISPVTINTDSSVIVFQNSDDNSSNTALDSSVKGTDHGEMRIMYWWGKVNQHVNIATKLWETDPDGVSGANLDKLTYCKKWYPNTIAVKPWKEETTNTWQERGNVNYYTSIKMSDRCIQG